MSKRPRVFVVVLKFRKKHRKITLIVGILMISIGLFAVEHLVLNLTAHSRPAPTFRISETAVRNHKINLSIASHPVGAVVGDFQRLSSFKNTKFKTVALDNCTSLHILNNQDSTHLGFEENSFAYILSLNGGMTEKDCSLDKIITAYGKPNQSVVLAGTAEHPQELLLFYDGGSKPITGSASTSPSARTNTVLPISLAQLPHTACPSASTSLNIIAHEDDDLLFLNPDVVKNIKAGNCVRTIYLTAGDAGNNDLYWQSRERASQAAYDYMTGNTSFWVHRTVKLAEHQYITVINPRANLQVSLIFMRLPDGQPSGAGYSITGYESLKRLKNGDVRQLDSVDGTSAYNASSLVAALTNLMKTYQPTQILAQTPYEANQTLPDHSDHITGGQFVAQAYQIYHAQVAAAAIKFYTGYSIRVNPENLSQTEAYDKRMTFFKYAQFDSAVCKNDRECNGSPYISYTHRKYVTGDHNLAL